MTAAEVLSVRVRKGLKGVERLGINLREVVERGLSEAIEGARRKRLERAVEEISKYM